MTDADRLREAGLRVTSARLAILEAVRAGSHSGTDEIARAHIVCRRCGTVADADRVTGHTLCLEPLASAGFAIDRAEVTFWGLCPQCRARRDQPGESAAQRLRS